MTSGELVLNTERDKLGSDTTLASMCQELEAFLTLTLTLTLTLI